MNAPIVLTLPGGVAIGRKKILRTVHLRRLWFIFNYTNDLQKPEEVIKTYEYGEAEISQALKYT